MTIKSKFDVAAFVQAMVRNRTSDHGDMVTTVTAAIAEVEQNTVAALETYRTDPAHAKRMQESGLNAFLAATQQSVAPENINTMITAIALAAGVYIQHHREIALEVLDNFEVGMITCAYEQGVGWGMEDRGADRNPYPLDSAGAKAWKKGYMEGAQRAKHMTSAVLSNVICGDTCAFLEDLTRNTPMELSRLLAAKSLLERITNQKEFKDVPESVEK